MPRKLAPDAWLFGVAVVLGAGPFVDLGSQAKIPHAQEKLGVAGALAGRPIELVACKTVDAEVPADAASYQRIVLIFDGGDADAVAAARARWSEAKASRHEVTYWQPDEDGRWQRKA